MNVRLINETLAQLEELVMEPMFIEYYQNMYYLYAYIDGGTKEIASGMKQDIVLDLKAFISIANLTRG